MASLVLSLVTRRRHLDRSGIRWKLLRRSYRCVIRSNSPMISPIDVMVGAWDRRFRSDAAVTAHLRHLVHRLGWADGRKNAVLTSSRTVATAGNPNDEDQHATNRPIEPSTAISELDVTPTAMVANTPVSHALPEGGISAQAVGDRQ